MRFLQVKYPDVELLKQFIAHAGTSLQSFRYFQKRPLDVIKNHLCTFLLLDDEKPVAYGHLDVTDEQTAASNCDSKEKGFTTEKTIWLGIAVAEGYRGKGLGIMMMNQLISFGKLHGVKTIRLSVDNDNGSAIALYEKLGFKKQEQKETFSFYELELA